MAMKAPKRKVAVLGAGKLGGILIQALVKAELLDRDNIRATVRHPERADALRAKLKVQVGTNNVEAVRGADVILVCVKPQVVGEVMREIRQHITPKQLLISVAASVPTSDIEKALGKKNPCCSRHAQHSLRARSRNDCAVRWTTRHCGRCGSGASNVRRCRENCCC